MHLSNDDLLAAVEDQTCHVGHLDACDACRGRVQELRGILSEARGIEIPEPSPLFWDHFSERVRASVAEERRASVGAPSRGWVPALLMQVSSWTRWGWASPAGVLAALAIVVIAVAIARSPDRSAGSESATAGLRGTGAPGSSNALPSLAPADDPSWVFMMDLAGDLNWEDAGAAGLVARPGSAERALENLSLAERQTLLDVLQQELRNRAISSI